MEDRLINKRLDLLELQEKISIMCELVEDRYKRNILIEACVLGHPIIDVAEDNFLSVRQIYRILGSCYDEISRRCH